MKIEYESSECADVGVADEIYLENIGMVRRTNTTIAGPAVFDLAEARIGSLSFAERPFTKLRLGVREIEDSDHLLATIRLTVDSDRPLTLTYASSQEYDLLLRDADGIVLWQWSEGQVFLPATSERIVDRELVHTIEVPLVLNSGKRLPKGIYMLEAWLAAGESRRLFSSAVNFSIEK